jgi:hypothetical protein
MKRYKHSWAVVNVDTRDRDPGGERYPASIYWMAGDGGRSKARVIGSDGAYDVHNATSDAEAKMIGAAMASQPGNGLQDDVTVEYGFLVWNGRLVRGFEAHGPVSYEVRFRGMKDAFEYPVIMPDHPIMRELTTTRLKKLARMGRA